MKAVMSETHNIIGLPQETRKNSNKQFNFTLKGTGKKSKQQTKPEVNKKKEIIQKVNETKTWSF